ncbi:hypothetical protein GPECTOR_10g948 [Gonium pectorale]|uniref:Uncharacterized protein n=1 Tax=Gonium pectorale TaxID=33097 RepID=A0A150GR16_GONPE|nr:hypothetical protein GPECTOR_10g948 [Gonium pectorale]|eukprot:KXZ52316.1 hypothetical protein GPECTOR_10g948 [Gonium pectorale]
MDTTNEEEMPQLDRERAERMRRNAEMLAKIGVADALRDVARAQATERAGGEPGTSGRGAVRQAPRPKRARTEAVEPTRRSSRLASGPTNQGTTEAGEAAEAAGVDEEGKMRAGKGVGIMTQEEYLASKGLPLPEGHFKTNGVFRGWVAPDVIDKFGLASSADEAWAQGGGGAFKRKITKADVPEHLRAKGWSTAKAFAASQLHKNPNAYFYRHVAPGNAQAQGEWTQEEHELFLATARKWGVGDKWGLFASYIPNRVGYQCSQYYTQVIIPSGIVIDPRFRMDSWGDAVFTGR